MFRTSGKKQTSSKNQRRDGEVSEPDPRMVFAVLAVGVLVGAVLMPGKSPASAKAKTSAPISAAAGK